MCIVGITSDVDTGFILEVQRYALKLQTLITRIQLNKLKESNYRTRSQNTLS